MKILFAHTDLRLYWPARLAALKQAIQPYRWNLEVVEIAGDGSPYAFAGKSTGSGDFWHCLFPDSKIEEIPAGVAADELFRLLDRKRPDVIFAGGIPFTSGAVAVRWAKDNAKKVVIFDDIRPQDVRRNRIVNWVKRRIYANVDAMFIPAPSHTPGFEEWGVPKQRMFFGIDVVDNDYFTDNAAAARNAAATTRAELHLPPRYLLAVGRQVPRKNWLRALEAWGDFCRTSPDSDLSLVFLGEGPERSRLEAFASERGLPRVHFHNFVPPAKLPDYYGCAEALIIPSYWESWGLVVNEAMAASLPIILSTECGCCDTLVSNGENGWCLDPYDTQGISRAIQELDALSPEARTRMGEASLEKIRGWGLERFCTGAIEAVNFVWAQHPRKGTGIDPLLLKAWKGRYHQT